MGRKQLWEVDRDLRQNRETYKAVCGELTDPAGALRGLSRDMMEVARAAAAGVHGDLRHQLGELKDAIARVESIALVGRCYPVHPI